VLACKNFIDGNWVDPSSAELMTSINPANGEPVASSSKSTIEDVKSAVDSARRALESTTWSEDATLRAKALLKLSSEIQANSERLAELLSTENGKVLGMSRIEAARSAEFAEYYGGLARNIFGRSSASAPNTLDVTLREPVGVVGVIAPWNGPLLLLMRSLAPALAAGNAAVIKPASYTFGVTTELVRLIAGISEFPAGVVNHVIGAGKTVGAELATNPGVDMIALTGDTETGREVMRLASSSLKRLSLELGGKSPNIILDDADFDTAIKGALTGANFGSAGQICYSGTRILVHDRIHESFLRRLGEILPRMKIGNGLDPHTEIPPVVSKVQMERILGYVEKGKGVSRLVTGGGRATEGELSRGYFVEPTVFDEPPLDSAIAQEEIFGPVLTVSSFKTEDELLSIANGTTYGLAAGIWTKSIDRAIHLAKKIQAGTVWINSYGRMSMSSEFGGYKQSGIGRTFGPEGLLEFTQIKRIAIQTDPRALAF